MKKNLLKSIGNGLSITLLVFTIAFLVMLFSSGEDGLRQILFNSLYFNAVTINDELVSLEFGTSDNFLIVFLCMSLLFSFINFCMLNYSNYKNN